MESLTINIKGMTCGGCVKSVSNVLQPLTGVSNVVVSLEKNNATITFDPSLAQTAQFKSAVEDAGFDVT